MWICDKCNTENLDDDLFCVECGSNKSHVSDNCCSNPGCTSYNVPLTNPTQKYCGKCHSATTYWQKVQKALGH